MPSLRILFAATLLGLCFITPLQAAEVPSSSEVQRNLDSLAERKLPEAEQKALQKTYEQTLSFLAQASASEQPAPAAAPSTAAITGSGQAFSDRIH